MVEALSLKMLSELIEQANRGLRPYCMAPLFTGAKVRANHAMQPAPHKVIESSKETDSSQITTKPPEKVGGTLELSEPGIDIAKSCVEIGGDVGKNIFHGFSNEVISRELRPRRP